MGNTIVFVLFGVALVAIVVAFIQSSKPVKVSFPALKFLRDNFDALVDKRITNEVVVTAKSLRAAKAEFPTAATFLDELASKAYAIGHEIDDPDAKDAAAAAVASSIVSPMGSAIAAAAFVSYGISKADLERKLNEV